MFVLLGTFGGARLADAAHTNVVHVNGSVEIEAVLVTVAARECGQEGLDAAAAAAAASGHIIGRLTHHSGVGVGVAQVEEHLHAALFALEVLAFAQVVDGGARQRLDACAHVAGHVGLVEQQVARLLLFVHDVGERQAVGRQDARVAVDAYGANAERASDGARVLSASAAETGEQVLARVVAFAFGEIANRSTHGFVGHAHKAERHLLQRHGRQVLARLVRVYLFVCNIDFRENV